MPTRLKLSAPPSRRRSSEVALAALYDREFLRASARPPLTHQGREIRVVDLFSGCGAMSLGLWEACRAVGYRMNAVLALDSNTTALDVYNRNFPGVNPVAAPVETILDRELGAHPSLSERILVSKVGRVDILVGGPPCQGHSNLNNYTRRHDPKNKLYDRMARFAELVRPRHVIIENVSAVLHDKGRIVDKTIAHLEQLGYQVDDGIAEAVALGVPQKRRRHIVVASLRHQPHVQSVIQSFSQPTRSVGWAIGDIANGGRDPIFDASGKPSSISQARIGYLFEHDLYELPDALRPDCHRLKPHTYKSVYGRLRWDGPAPTITSGFLSMGQGRYVHSKRPRTITPHEAARLQFIPDFFDFRGVKSRTSLAEMIGNAVPSKLAYVFGIDLLR